MEAAKGYKPFGVARLLLQITDSSVCTSADQEHSLALIRWHRGLEGDSDGTE